MVAKKKDSAIFQLKVTLKHIRPPIWRRIQVQGDTTLDTLHDIIQVAMGWTNTHLHQFIVNNEYYGEPHSDYGLEMKDQAEVRLNEIVGEEKDKFAYEYDFGDNWEHVVLVEKVLEPEPDARYPRCVKGKRQVPPEDIGGPWGYGEFLEALEDEDHPQHDEYMNWMGGEFNPDAFDLAEVNEGLEEMG